MIFSTKKSSTHQHLTRPVFKKAGSAHPSNSVAVDEADKVKSGFGKLEVGTEVLSVPAAYKSIFSL